MSTPPQAASNPRVWLTLLLDGGHEESLSVDARSPLLPLLGQVLAKHPNAPLQFEILLREGAALLTLPAHRLVAVKTDPPVPLLAFNPVPTAPTESLPPHKLASAPAPGIAPGVYKSSLLQVQNVLTAKHLAELLEFVRANEAAFLPSGTTTGAANYRESLVCGQFAPFDALLKARIAHLLPKVCEKLGISVPDGGLDAQLTAHNDGNFYKVHNDNGSDALEHRQITFVYYFHQQPKNFTGGELRLWDSDIHDGYRHCADAYKDIQPTHNSMVFFDSALFHEVLPVVCPSGNFHHSRFTINGWLSRKTAS